MNFHATMPAARLLGLGTAVPGHLCPQDMVKTVARRLLGDRYADFDRLTKSFDNAGIATRYSVVPFDWFETTQDWPSRTKAYLEGATALFIEAAERALDESGWRAEDVDTIITISSTGIATPTLEARAMRVLNFRPDVQRVPVFGLGCAGGVTGLALAARLAGATPGSKVLLVAVETCTLSFRADRMQKADIIATVLFGDGAAAACVSTDGGESPVLGQGAEHTWPDTLPIMGWDVDREGFGVVFDRSIPEFVKQHLANAVNGSLEKLDLQQSDLSRLICHPGGAKVIEAIESALHLQQGALDHEREVLRDFGNMSAPTALFVLKRVLADSPSGTMLLTALGPGFTASVLPVRFS